ncbi:MAG TPA: hypothetical protein VK475_12585, partial [Pyrinomonadaceae bacterium]|nr:hypothetical protein [Pyrinomonadaceae bacterium]
MPTRNDKLKFVLQLMVTVVVFTSGGSVSIAQNPAPSTETLKKANPRPAGAAPATKTEPFDGAPVEKMTGKCVTLE